MHSHAREEKASRQSTKGLNRKQTRNCSPYPKAEIVAQACALATY